MPTDPKNGGFDIDKVLDELSRTTPQSESQGINIDKILDELNQTVPQAASQGIDIDKIIDDAGRTAGRPESPRTDLEKNAAEGRKPAQQREAAKKAEAESEGTEESREGERLRRHSVSAYARWGFIVAWLLITAGIGVVYEFSPAAGHEEYDENPVGGLLMVIWFVLIGVAYFVRPMFGHRALRREKAWLLGLPFQLSGYLDCLAHYPRNGVATVWLSFQASLPERELLANVLLTVDAEIDPGAYESAKRPVVASRRFSVSDSTRTNAHLRSWVHDLVERCRVLHATYPLEEIAISVSW